MSWYYSSKLNFLGALEFGFFYKNRAKVITTEELILLAIELINFLVNIVY